MGFEVRRPTFQTWFFWSFWLWDLKQVIRCFWVIFNFPFFNKDSSNTYHIGLSRSLRRFTCRACIVLGPLEMRNWLVKCRVPFLHKKESFPAPCMLGIFQKWPILLDRAHENDLAVPPCVSCFSWKCLGQHLGLSYRSFFQRFGDACCRAGRFGAQTWSP